MGFTNFKNVSDFFKAQETDAVSQSLRSWLDWAFLEIGAFASTSVATSGYYGGDTSRLRPVSDPYYTDGQVWEGFRSNWVYESGTTYGLSPIRISGVYINGSLTPVGSGYSINYPLGRVVFNSGIGTGSVIRCEYSYKYVNVSSSDVPWFREFQFDSQRIDSSNFLQVASGTWNTLAQSRVQLPAVVVEPTNRISFQGAQLGGGLWRNQDFLFHIFAETPWDRNSIADILVSQKDKTIFVYDPNKIAASGVFPLAMDGSVNPLGLMYPDLVAERNPYRLRRCMIVETGADDFNNNQPLYISVIRLTCETQLPPE
jgi:hypothetical protein